MFDRFVIRIQKEDRGLKPLPYVVWTEGASIPRPESIEPFDENKIYAISDVISYDKNTLMVCKTKPETGYSRDALSNVNLTSSHYDTESKIFSFKGETYVLMVQSPASSLVSDATVNEPSGEEGEVFIFKWDIVSGNLVQIAKLLNTPLNSLDVFYYDERLFFTGGLDTSIEHTASKIWEFDGSSISVVTSFELADKIYRFRLGTREFLFGTKTNSGKLTMYQFDPVLGVIGAVTSLDLEPGTRLKSISHIIYRGAAYVFLAIFDTTRDKTDLFVYRFDNISKTLRLENSFEYQDEILCIQAKEINSESYLLVAGKNSFISVLQFEAEEKVLVHRSEVPKIFDHKGTDTDISGYVYNLSFFDDGDNLYMNIPVYQRNGSHEALTVTCFWEPNEQNFVPFKGIETTGAYSWHVFETDQGFFSYLSQHIKDDGTTAKSEIYGWDLTTKKFTTAFEKIAGGSIWNIDDWEELQTSTAIVRKFNPNHTYRADMYIMDDDENILRLKRPTTKGYFVSDDWEEIHPKQRFSTLHFYQQFNAGFGPSKWSSGVLVQIKF